MKVKIKNLGPFKEAEYSLDKLTIICGGNNTGKTYATYALYGFFDFWKNGFLISIDDKKIEDLFEETSVKINIPTNVNEINEIIKNACKVYIKFIPKILTGNKKYFENTDFSIEIDENDISVNVKYDRSLGTPKKEFLHISKEEDDNSISINMLAVQGSVKKDRSIISNIKRAISEAIKEIVFSGIFSNIFIASAERTGAVIFKNEIISSDDIDPFTLIEKAYSSEYPLPVRHNINFIRKLEENSKNNSFITRNHPDIIKDFNNIVGGTFKVQKEGLFYIPDENKKVKLTVGGSPSSVRSLFDVGFYLKHIAEKGDLLIIDEPELNLHPSNQRKLAKLFVRLINVGIKIYITTHSDYIIKELNTLIMFNNEESPETLLKKYKYKKDELLHHESVKAFIAKKEKMLLTGNERKTNEQTLVPAKITKEYGIEAESFDNTIIEMNQIQEAIILGRR